MLHHQHRNATTPPGFTNEMLIHDSVVHEFDAVRFFTGEEITSVQVRLGKRTRNAPEGQHDPQHVLLETESGVLADVEIYVNAQYGYEVATQASFEEGVVSIGSDSGPYVRTQGRWGGTVTPGFEERFGAAYDVEIQAWVDAALKDEIGGPSAWDGYATAACCEAGVEGGQDPVDVVDVDLRAERAGQRRSQGRELHLPAVALRAQGVRFVFRHFPVTARLLPR